MSEDERRGYLRRQRMAIARRESRKLLFDGDFDGYIVTQHSNFTRLIYFLIDYSLIISSRYAPETVIETLIPYVSGSRRIVVYSHSKEVLLNAAASMRKSTEFIAVDITESSLRQYQVK